MVKRCWSFYFSVPTKITIKKSSIWWIGNSDRRTVLKNCSRKISSRNISPSNWNSLCYCVVIYSNGVHGGFLYALSLLVCKKWFVTRTASLVVLFVSCVNMLSPPPVGQFDKKKCINLVVNSMNIHCKGWYLLLRGTIGYALNTMGWTRCLYRRHWRVVLGDCFRLPF